jgi:hypothetical protein
MHHEHCNFICVNERTELTNTLGLRTTGWLFPGFCAERFVYRNLNSESRIQLLYALKECYLLIERLLCSLVGVLVTGATLLTN